jgi:hypothetical protein
MKRFSLSHYQQRLPLEAVEPLPSQKLRQAVALIICRTQLILSSLMTPQTAASMTLAPHVLQNITVGPALSSERTDGWTMHECQDNICYCWPAVPIVETDSYRGSKRFDPRAQAKYPCEF